MTDGLASYSAATARVPELAAVEPLRVRAAARLHTRVEQSHQPTRPRERVRRRYTSVPFAQHCRSAFRRCCHHVCVRRHRLTAAEPRAVRHVRYEGWRELALVAVAT